MQAQKNLAKPIDAALHSLKAAGAVRVKRTFITTRPPTARNWHDFIPSFRQWYLTGLDANGKAIAKSGAFPSDTKNLASRLVTLNYNFCWLKKGEAPQCAVAKSTPSNYLYAALRSWIDQSGTGSWGNDLLQFVYGEIEYCLTSGQKFTLSKATIYCPGNLDITQADPHIALHFYSPDLMWGYDIAVNQTALTAVIAISPPDYSGYGSMGFVEKGSDVINFSK